ncbi:MAG: chorismate synthase [Bacteroidetes bacterium]|nr:chorismate synthase [Bacteroidota bacterium]
MSGSTFGRFLRLTTYGESHGEAIGGILDGFPSNFEINFEELQTFVDKRKPGQSKLVTQRKESDTIQVLSGVFEGKSLGTPIAFMVPNEDAKSKDYSNNKDVYRPSHADLNYQQKYGIRDHRGGGRSSARETVARVIAGGIAKQFLESEGIFIQAFVDQIGSIRLEKKDKLDFLYNESSIEASLVRCPEPQTSSLMEELVLKTKKDGDSIGGAIFCRIKGVPFGLGEPVFDKLHAKLGQALFSINAVKGVEFGSGFSGIEMLGSQHNDLFVEGGKTESNNSGGIIGGISNSMPIDFRVAFKPVATIAKPQQTINSELKEDTIQGKGRHDACVVPRAVPIVEAMAALTILDFYLMYKIYK